LPENLLKEVMEGNIANFRMMKDSGIYDMEKLESNWVSSPSITEQLVYKCFEFYGQISTERAAIHMNFDLDLTTPRTRDYEEKERSRSLISIGIFVIACVLVVLLWYAVNYFIKLR